jgi:kumamolisin
MSEQDASSTLAPIPFTPTNLVCRPYFKRRDGNSYRARIARRLPSASYTPLQIKKAYGIPDNLDGSGTVVGIIELGGAWSSQDYAQYMSWLGFNSYRAPIVVGNPSPDPNGADVEVMLDSCVIGGMAPQAQQRIYFYPNTDAGFVNAINKAVDDNCDVISISWGAPEGQWSSQAKALMDSALQKAITKKINTYVASGDNGSSDGTSANAVDYPASSPYSIGCGGTNLQLKQDGSIASETVWNDGTRGGATGGGYSNVYPMPEFQRGVVNGSMRGVPDVAGVGDPESGWSIRANGQTINVGGTSAVAPMWAAIQCLLNQKAGLRAWSVPLFYKTSSWSWFRDTITGSNGAFNAGPGWDGCTGLGSPDGERLFATQVPTPTPTPVPTPTPTPQPTPTPSVGNLHLATTLNPGYYGLLPLSGPGRYASVHTTSRCTPGSYGLTSSSLSEMLGREIPYHLTRSQIEAILSLINKYGPDAMTLVEEILRGVEKL